MYSIPCISSLILSASLIFLFPPAGLLLGAAVSWICYRQQRSRLADIDPATYSSGSSGGSGGSGSNGNSAGGWQHTPDASRREGDGMPLLYHPQHHFDLQQQQAPSGVGALPV
jgi:hypothetical protein